MAKTGHPNFQLKMWGPWRGIQHRWSMAHGHSGQPFTTQADAISFLNSYWDNVSPFFGKAWTGVSGFYCAGWSYYNGTTSAALWEKDYTNQTEAGADGFLTTYYGDAYAAEGVQAAPEVCVRLQAPVGNSSTGKPVYNKIFVHYCDGTPGSASDEPNFGSGAAGYAANLGNGSLFDSRVLISPGGKQGAWVPYTYYANHQMQRRRKKSSSSSSITGTALKLAEQLIAEGLDAL